MKTKNESISYFCEASSIIEATIVLLITSAFCICQKLSKSLSTGQILDPY